jgi:NAD(P)-dependent dehydrogenase (short-subunit alcohol dehydrogenase family)
MFAPRSWGGAVIMPELDSTPVPDYGGALRLDGRGVVVVGAGQGIGRQTAHGAAALGARVACFDTDPARAAAVAEAVGGVACVGDAAKRTDMERMFAEAAAELGRIDAIVDIVGMPRYRPILETEDADWDFQHDVTLRQAFLAMQIGGRRMAATGGGAMAFVSSVSGVTSAPGHAGYGAAKAGLNSMVRSAAVEFARHGIRVNAAAPGLIWTPRVSESMSPEARTGAERSIPLRRVGQPSDIAGVLLFLISDLAAYVTGQTLVVDGGATATFPLAMRTLPPKPAQPGPGA